MSEINTEFNACMFKQDCMARGAELAIQKDKIRQLEQELANVSEQLASANEQLAEAKKDQARYLKLIETGNFCPTQYSGLWGLHMSGEPYTKAELDAPIDKAIAAIKESK